MSILAYQRPSGVLKSKKKDYLINRVLTQLLSVVINCEMLALL